MPDLSTLLDRAIPDDLAPIDVDLVGRLARQRRQRRVRRGAAAAVLVVLGAVGGMLLAAPGSDETKEQVTAVAPDRPTVTAGMGTWSQLPEAPFSDDTELFSLSDGRLLAWGSTALGFGSAGEERAYPALAIYDPDAEIWSTVEHPASLDALHLYPARFADDRLAVVGSINGDSRFSGSVFDATTGDWTAIPALEQVRVIADAIAWDGATFALVRTAPGEVGPVSTWLGPDTGDSVNADPDDPTSPYSSTIDYRIDAPQTWRWTLGADAWSRGQAPPLSMRITTGSAFDGSRLAIVGGTEGAAGTNDASLSRSDGAIYDVDADRWEQLPDLPWAGVNPAVAWIDATLVVAGGEPDLAPGPDDGPDELNGRVVQLSDDGRSWVELPPAPELGATVSWPSAFEHPGDSEPVVQRYSFLGDPAKPEGAALLDGSWEATPTRSLHRWQETLVATSDALANPGDGPYSVKIRRGPDDWVASADAPFANRMRPAVAVVGDQVFVVGGLTGSGVEPDRTAWVLDLSATG